ncbi:hypothetical protein DICPUDRAFT_42183 [Dictyostelium purpureum]|uniref:Cytochrome P450 family protein n=1 Tax=Dictyostelium purpureum TaxID=5786 RepID=F1A1L5_DICPU|nr:uncharacterized protein DICPUDRAFT_42183 [Dictyostelium purpureum]EGC29920.1 hypothetical protein DICPUDRAFT_42183 [Dictyostelium purpureum]|eukprot:XP_003293561.1 hypothetical protein DICPUDRAFT_42183 [Dictyostelium purpureum]
MVVLQIVNTFIMILLLLVTILVIKDLVYLDKKKRLNQLIPGPKGVPIFGNLLQINVKDVPANLDELYKKYGSIFRLRLGNVETVVLTGGSIMEESFIKNWKLFENRYIRMSRYFAKDLEILFSNGDYHKKLKNILIGEITTRKLTNGNSLFNVNKNVGDMMKKIYKDDKTVVENLPFYIKGFILKIILEFTFGREEDDEKISKMIVIVSRLFQTAGQFIYSDYVPLMIPIDLINTSKSSILSDFFYFRNYSNNILEKLNNNKSNNFDNDETIQTNKPLIEYYYDMYLQGEIKYESVLFSASDVIVAGLDTTSNTLSFFIVALINNPHIQEKIFEEIRNNNTSDDITYSDQTKYPYTNAVLRETHRYFSVVPIPEPFVTSDDVEINGYKIAKGTQIIKNLGSTHLSEEFWEDPLIFKPERFLTEEKKKIYHFGVGKRVCPGNSFGTIILFLSAVLLVKNFIFVNPSPHKPINEKGLVGLVSQCRDFNVILKKRQ